MELFAQTVAVGYALTFLGLVLGVVMICIPRLRRKDIHDDGKKKKRRKR